MFRTTNSRSWDWQFFGTKLNVAKSEIFGRLSHFCVSTGEVSNRAPGKTHYWAPEEATAHVGGARVYPPWFSHQRLLGYPGITFRPIDASWFTQHLAPRWCVPSGRAATCGEKRPHGPTSSGPSKIWVWAQSFWWPLNYAEDSFSIHWIFWYHFFKIYIYIIGSCRQSIWSRQKTWWDHHFSPTA